VFGASPLVLAWLFLLAALQPAAHLRALSECLVCLV
jgi:hypothetical protein